MNEQFLNRMKIYLKDEYDAYVNSLQQPLFKGLRINPLKTSKEEIIAMNLCGLKPSKICKNAFAIDGEVEGLGNTHAHGAGLFYMQEPSASSAVEILDVQKGDWVLDLCAAPGGKSTQIAAALENTGFLVSNEIEKKRAQILLGNMERLGFYECMITNTTPKELCKAMSGCFDKVLVDAPCSGEGMFKKHSSAMEDWSVAHVEACATRQKHILESAYDALKTEGILVYSTCTYSMEENEEVIADFLMKHEDVELLDCNVDFGRSGFECAGMDASKVRRIFPMDHGEGHFVAKMIKHGYTKMNKLNYVKEVKLANYVGDFMQQQRKETFEHVVEIQGRVYAKHSPFISLKNIPILRQGIFVGEIVKNRLEPHHHFYMSGSCSDDFKQVYEMSDEECLKYRQGNVLQASGIKGYACVSYHHHPIGFVKGDGMVLKNKYPKGLRLVNKG